MCSETSSHSSHRPILTISICYHGTRDRTHGTRLWLAPGMATKCCDGWTKSRVEWATGRVAAPSRPAAPPAPAAPARHLAGPSHHADPLHPPPVTRAAVGSRPGQNRNARPTSRIASAASDRTNHPDQATLCERAVWEAMHKSRGSFPAGGAYRGHFAPRSGAHF